MNCSQNCGEEMKAGDNRIITKNRILDFAIAFMITFAVFVLGGFSSSDILLGLVFVAILVALERGRGRETGHPFLEKDKRTKRITLLVSAIWTVSYLIYSAGNLTGGMENRLFVLVYELLAAVGIFAGIYWGLSLVVTKLTMRRADYVEEKEKQSFSLKKMALYSAIVFIAMLPLFILNYPATMTVDSFEQMRQARGMMAYSDHHPWIHTMIIKLFYSIGYGLTGRVNAAIAAYVLMQMLVTAVSVGYSAAVVESIKKKKAWSILIILAFVLYPYHAAYAITIWKDILFSDMVLIFTVLIYKNIKTIKEDNSKLSVLSAIALTISGTGVCLLRHNGLYAYILTAFVFLPAVLADYKKKKANAGNRMLVCLAIVLITLLVSLVVKGPVQKLCGVSEGDYAHNLAIPLQQIGRTVSDGGEISEADRTELEKINTMTYIINNYEPGGADNMIQWLAAGNADYFMEHKAEYLAIWARIGINNPVSYLRAYADQTKGYYTCMMPEQIAYYGILDNEDGLETTPLAGAGVRIKTDELCSKIQDMIPVYGIFYSMGACLLILILWMAVAVIKGEYDRLLATMPVLALTLTILIATPLVADLRYAYPLMLCFPTLTAILIGTEK